MKKLTKQSRIGFVELPATQYGILNGPLDYDIYSEFGMPPRAISTLRRILVEDGWTNTSETTLIKDILELDALLMSTITRTYPQSAEQAREYKAKNPKNPAIAGGTHVTFMPEEALRNGFDIVVRGEGEKTLKELMIRLREDPNDLSDIKGITYKQNGQIIENPDRELLTEQELSETHPFYDKEVIKKIRTATIEGGRGCPFDCDFCSVTTIYGHQYRRKSREWILEELRRIKNYGINTMWTNDNIGMGPLDTEIFEAIADSGLNRPKSVAQITVNAAYNDRLLMALKRAGIEVLCVGFESISDETLKAWNKPSTAKRNKEAAKKFRDAGFFVHGMMMIGGDGDTKESLEKTSEWANESLDSAQFSAPITLPGTRFYKKMEDERRILTKDWFLYTGHNVTSRPLNFSPLEHQLIIEKAYRNFYSVRNIPKRLKGSSQRVIALEVSALTLYKRMLNKLFNNPQYQQHLKFLKSVS